MRILLISISFIFVFIKISTAQIVSKDTLIENNYSEISISKKYNSYYLQKSDGYAIQATHKGSYGPKKDVFLRFLKDVPEIYSLALNNLSVYRTDYGLGLIHCYNDYQRSGRTKELNQEYFEQFGLISMKEYRHGPTKEKLKNPKRITGVVKHVVVLTDHYTNHMLTSSTHGEYHKFKFYYGNHFYKGGFAIKNLKRVVGQDNEAMQYVKQYRRRFFTRASIISVGFVQAGLAIAWGVTGEAPFGMSNAVGIAVLSPGVIFLNVNNIFPQRYKTRLINKTIDTYNRNLFL